MKHFCFAFCFSVLGMGWGHAQGDDPLIGEWKNTYGSVLTIGAHDPKSGLFLGTYSSSTGATGSYWVVGNSPVGAAGQAQPISLTVSWRPKEGAKGTPDEMWTSSMSGQVALDDSGQWYIEALHMLNASSPLPAVDILKAGRYTETLRFVRSSGVGGNTYPEFARLMALAASSFAAPIENPLRGEWVNSPGEVYPSLHVESVGGSSLPGIFLGSIVRNDNPLPVVGCTTPLGGPDDVRSVSLSFMGSDTYGSVCYSASGFLYEGKKLELAVAEARIAPYKAKYTSVQLVDKAVFTRYEPAPIDVVMSRNPFTNNGATEWTASFSVGSSPTPPLLKFGVDTGGNFLWANSTQCTTESCTKHGHVQFDPSASPTFRWLDKNPKSISWGPWGTAIADVGSDYIGLGAGRSPLRYNMKLITHFDNTPQFDEFLWDGAIALPAASDQMASPTSHMLKTLLDQGKLLPTDDKICVAFYFDPQGRRGMTTFGGWDSTQVEPSSKLVFTYGSYPQVPYLWCSSLSSFAIGDKQVANKGFYSFDTGSSALKGDSAAMLQTLAYAQQEFKRTGKWPVMKFSMGKDLQGQTGYLELTGQQYVQLIEEGEHAGERIPQIQTLGGTPGLYLQGSTMLNYVYTVFWWDVHTRADGSYDLTAREVWLFNKKGGPAIIKKAPQVAQRPKRDADAQWAVYPNPSRGKIYIDVDLAARADVEVNLYYMSGWRQGQMYHRRYENLAAGKHTLQVERLDRLPPSIKRNIILKLMVDKKIVLTKRMAIR